MLGMFSSVVDVAGVVDGSDEPTCDEFKVEEDTRCATPFPLCPLVSPGYGPSCFPFALAVEGRLLLLCNLWNIEGMAGMLQRCDAGLYACIWVTSDGRKTVMSSGRAGYHGGRVMQRGRRCKVGTGPASGDNGNSWAEYVGQANERRQKMLDSKAKVVVGIVLRSEDRLLST